MVSVLESNRFFSLRTKHEGKYLQSVYSRKAGGSRIEASADAVAGNTRARFSVQPSRREHGLVHVICCYNNKYWVAVKDSGSGRWVIGTADEPKEDLSSDSCTLFAPIASGDQGDSIRFRHPGLKKYARVLSIDGAANPYLQLAADEENSADVFTVLGFSQQKELPKYIALKQYDGKYLAVRSRQDLYTSAWTLSWDEPPDGPVLVFVTKDKLDAGVLCTVHTNDDGTVRITSNKGNLYWKRDHHDRIVPVDGWPSPTDAATFFKVLTSDKGVKYIALRNMLNNKICKIRRDSMSYEYLNAEESSISKYTELEFDEPVRDRRIYDLQCHLEEARYYNSEPVKSMPRIHNNVNSDTVLTSSFSFVQKTAKETKWQSNVSKTIGLQSSISIGTGDKSPVQINGTITVSKENTSSEGKETTESKGDEVTLTDTYTVNPRKTKAAQLVATRSSVDVPYSYKQWILLSNGEEIFSTHDHDICTVTNNYGFHVVITDDPEEIKRLMGEKSSGGL